MKSTNRKFKKLNMFSSYGENPSVATLRDVLRVGVRVKEGEILSRYIDDDGVEQTSRASGDVIQYLKDSEPFYKGYFKHSGIIMSLPSIGVDMFCYVLEVMRKHVGCDYVALSKSGFAEFSGKKSEVSYYNGVSSLLDAGILYRMVGEEQVFYINVRVVFNGSRENLYRKMYGMDLSEHDSPSSNNDLIKE